MLPDKNKRGVTEENTENGILRDRRMFCVVGESRL